jgi:prenylcysteine oxidase/farnesylcysteine lyase
LNLPRIVKDEKPSTYRIHEQVTGLRKIASTSGSNSKWILSSTSNDEIPPYDHIIIAAPFAKSQISILGSPAASTLLQPLVEYVHLHVTLISTTAPHASPEYFGLNPTRTVPKIILTTWDAVRHARKSLQNDVKRPEFNSLGYEKMIETENGKEWVVKLFSAERLSDEWLQSVFAWGEHQIGWTTRKEVCYIAATFMSDC